MLPRNRKMTCKQCRETLKNRTPEEMKIACAKCRLPKISSANALVYGIIMSFYNIIWSGEGVDAYGIQKALEWSYVDKEDYPALARKMVAYFGEASKQLAEKHEKQAIQNKKSPKTFSK